MNYKVWFIVNILSIIYIYAVDINTNSTKHIALLPHSKIFIDHNRSETIFSIQNKPFLPIGHTQIDFGYAPKFDVWIAVELNNTTDTTLHKIIEYNNPLTSYVDFYDGKNHMILKQDGMLNTSSRNSVHPFLETVLQPHEAKKFFIKARSNTTALKLNLRLWDNKAFYEKEVRHQFISALFFGALGIITVYNFIIYLATREKSYLYYVLAFLSITLYYFMYEGYANIYLFTPIQMQEIVKYSTFIVALPILFLALFTKHMLALSNYPRIHRILNYTLVLFVLSTVICFLLDINKYRSIPSVIFLFIILGIVAYALKLKNKQAKFLLVGWLVFSFSGLFMFLSSQGVFDIYTYIPYFDEYALVVEAIAFSLSLSDKIKQLNKEKLEHQTKLATYQRNEKHRLALIVKEKTKELQQSLNEKELLLRELKHRINNSLLTITTFLSLQIDKTKHAKSKALLNALEKRIFAINDLYTLLGTSKNIENIHAHDYFSILINHLQTSFDMHAIRIRLQANITMHTEDIIYCGFILNEAVTNAFQHAFRKKHNGEIFVSLKKRGEHYNFIIRDNGSGYTKKPNRDALGLLIIKTLATEQLNGKFHLQTNRGVTIKITWKDTHG